jgi:hypothetical protein
VHARIEEEMIFYPSFLEQAQEKDIHHEAARKKQLMNSSALLRSARVPAASAAWKAASDSRTSRLVSMSQARQKHHWPSAPRRPTMRPAAPAPGT